MVPAKPSDVAPSPPVKDLITAMLALQRRLKRTLHPFVWTKAACMTWRASW